MTILNNLNQNQKPDEGNQEGEGPKILTPSQILSRLRITLAHLKAGNNSEKFKNDKTNKKHETIANNSPVQIYIDKTEIGLFSK